MKLDKVLISDSIDASCVEILKEAGISVDYQPNIAKDKLLSIIKVSLLAPESPVKLAVMELAVYVFML